MIDLRQLRALPAAYRPVAMWFLNGDLAEDEVARQVAAMAAGGVGGVQIAARTGLAVPYLSQRWFDLVARIIDEAARHNLDVWIADEYPYPSGAAGGEVILRHPEYRAWHMRATRLVAAPGEEVRAPAPGTVLLRACAVPVVSGAPRWDDVVALEPHVGLVQRDQILFAPTRVYLTTRRYMANGPRPVLQWRAPQGPDSWEVWLIAAAEIERYKFFGAYVDLCNADAVRFFIETTYQRYLERLGPERFARLAGFFVDEAHPQNWSWRLPDFFRRRRGYDLVEALPALWADAGPQTPQVRYDYLQSITELFVESFHRPLAAWCREHGVQLSLEVGSTRNVVQRYADVPGIDPGHEKVGTPLDALLARELPLFRANLDFPASLAAQTGKRRVLDELFHSTGWSLTLQDMKAMLDRAAARGANLFAFHAFCYTIGGLRKWDAPPSEFDQNPYWPHFPLLAGYAGRLAYAMSRGRRVAPVALLDPITSLWAHGEGVGAGRDDVARRLAGDWAYLMRELIAAQRPYDTLDPLLLAEASVEGGVLRLGEAEYRVVVLPPVTTLERAAWERLEAFAAAGGMVIACGLLPYETIEPGSEVTTRCASAFGVDALQVKAAYEQEGAGGSGRVATLRSGRFVLLRTAGTLAQAGAAATLLELLEEVVPVDLRLFPAAGEAARRQLLLAQRREGSTSLFLIASCSMEEHDCEVALRVAGERPAAITRLDLETGEAEPLETRWEPGAPEQRLRLRFPRHGAHLLLVEDEGRRTKDGGRKTEDNGQSASEDEGRRTKVSLIELGLDGEWRCTAEGDNALRLDRFRFTMAEDAEAADLEAAAAAARERLEATGVPVIEPKPLVNVLQDLASRGEPWPGRIEVVPTFGATPRLRLALPAVLWYGASIEVQQVPASARLCLEGEAFSGDWAVWINGQRIDRAAFAPSRRWTAGNLEVEAAPLLRPGRNEVLVRVRAREEWDGLLEPLYLLGGFGVAYEAGGTPTLTPPPAATRWEELFGAAAARGGYPHFAGTLHLQKTVSLSPPPGEVLVRLPDEALMFAGVAHLALNGQPLGTRAWAPFAWRVPPGLLRVGRNEVELSITTTLIGLLEGRRYDPQRREAVPIVGP
jgi:hypothetical protein